jgi:hypothetical protein
MEKEFFLSSLSLPRFPWSVTEQQPAKNAVQTMTTFYYEKHKEAYRCETWVRVVNL